MRQLAILLLVMVLLLVPASAKTGFYEGVDAEPTVADLELLAWELDETGIDLVVEMHAPVNLSVVRYEAMLFVGVQGEDDPREWYHVALYPDSEPVVFAGHAPEPWEAVPNVTVEDDVLLLHWDRVAAADNATCDVATVVTGVMEEDGVRDVDVIPDGVGPLSTAWDQGRLCARIMNLEGDPVPEGFLGLPGLGVGLVLVSMAGAAALVGRSRWQG